MLKSQLQLTDSDLSVISVFVFKLHCLRFCSHFHPCQLSLRRLTTPAHEVQNLCLHTTQFCLSTMAAESTE